ncbi:hypothetical protein [Marinilactibacillus kalidii]|uniref:hypothetical protein n=1 Tax=Marinilactibacillus kalidii TaxID=2820274 RepID=UPI001ABDDD5D|nr:hypothetical protein [Marinilactibacillus kalidii]
MKEYLKFETRLFIKDPKVIFLFLSIVAFLIGLLAYIPYHNIDSINDKTQIELNLVRDAIASYPMHIVGENPDAFPEYNEVLQESQLLGRQEVALNFYEDLQAYSEIGLALADNRVNAHEIGYDEISSSYTVPYEQARKEGVFYEYLLSQNIEIERNAENTVSYIVIATSYFSSVFFLFILFLSNDILTKDVEHKTLLRSFPIDENQKTVSKLIIHTVVTLTSLTGLFLLGYTIASFVFRSGNLDYPQILFTGTGYEGITTVQYLVRTLLLAAVLLVHTILLSAVLNSILNNKYLTIFAGGSLYVMSFLFSSSISFFKYTPLNYLNITDVLSGVSADKFNQSSNTFSRATFILLIWSVIYIIVLSLFFSRKNKIEAKPVREGN